MNRPPTSRVWLSAEPPHQEQIGGVDWRAYEKGYTVSFEEYMIRKYIKELGKLSLEVYGEKGLER